MESESPFMLTLSYVACLLLAYVVTHCALITLLTYIYPLPSFYVVLHFPYYVLFTLRPSFYITSVFTLGYDNLCRLLYLRQVMSPTSSTALMLVMSLTLLKLFFALYRIHLHIRMLLLQCYVVTYYVRCF